MEPPASTEPPVQIPGTENPVPPVPSSPSKPRRSPVLFLISLLLMVAVGIAAYAFGRWQGDSLRTPNPSPAIKACTEEAKICPDGTAVGRTGPNCEFAECPQDNEDSSVSTAELPEGWEYVAFAECNVEIPKPPYEEPYIGDAGSDSATGDEGNYWTFRTHTPEQKADDLFTSVAEMIFRRPDNLGSGYVPGLVLVSCAENTEQLSTEELFTQFQTYWNNSVNEPNTPVDLTFSATRLRKDNLWGNTVIVARVSGGMFPEDNEQYLFATSTHIYKVSKISMSQDPFVQQTTNQIFQLLRFE